MVVAISCDPPALKVRKTFTFTNTYMWQFRSFSQVSGGDGESGTNWESSIDIYQFSSVQFSSVAQSCLTLCNPMDTRPPCPSPTPRVCSNSCPSNQWCPPIISSSVIPFSSCLQSLPASGSFQMSQLFESGGQSIGELQHQSFQWIFRTDFL